MMQMIYNRYGGPANAWTGPWVGACCYESAPAVAQWYGTFQLWAVGNDSKLYQHDWVPGTGWVHLAPITNDIVGSAASITQYGSQFQVFYVMGDYTDTWETKQLVYDPNAGGWQPAAEFADLTSAPAVTDYGGFLQVWSRDPMYFNPSHRTQSGTIDCPNGGNYVDSACIGDGSTTFIGVDASWERNYLHHSSQFTDDHINNHLWLYTRSNLSTFVETGLAYYGCPQNMPGINCVNWPSSCQPCYGHIWAEQATDGSQDIHFIESPPIDGSRHDYSITQDAYNTSNWDVYFDGVQVDTATHQGSSAAYEAQVGLEVSKSAYYAGSIKRFNAATFHNSSLQFLEGPRQWNGWAYLNYWNDRPCMRPPSGGPANQPPGECMNGSTKGTTTWYVNKP
jgi:hypothetical protein